MLSLRNRFGIPGVISVIALVFAMFGGAYAASNSSDGGKATASAKAKRGPKGPKGAPGPAGPAGPQGPAGANGKDGANGQNGTSGSAGADGKSVVTTPIAEGGSQCEGYGGTEVEVEGSAAPEEVCNGEEGPQGPEGALGTAGTTLPPGVTLSGTWGSNTSSGANQLLYAPISFNIPLAAPLPVTNVHLASNGTGTGDLTSGSTTVENFAKTAGIFVKGDQISGTGIPAGTTISSVNASSLSLSAAATASGTGVTLTATPPASCDDGSAPPPTVVNPEAASGHLCAFVGVAEGLVPSSFLGLGVLNGVGGAGASPFGAAVQSVSNAANAQISGSWAVTGS